VIETLRGSKWRGRDCDDGRADVYPGRLVSDYPVLFFSFFLYFCFLLFLFNIGQTSLIDDNFSFFQSLMLITIAMEFTASIQKLVSLGKMNSVLERIL
jgi:hypothetical protein